MDVQTGCSACFLRQADEAVRLATADPALHAQLAGEAAALVAAATGTRSPVAVGQAVHRRVRELTGRPDPYLGPKQEFTRRMLAVLPGLEAMVRRSPDPLMTAARLAIAANAIDLAAGRPVAEDVVGALRGVLHLPFHGETAAFRAALDRATSVLYLTDNAGEIVVDRLLVEQLDPSRVTVAVRGAPVLNDATLAEARASGLADLPGLAGIVGNGSDAPGTLLEDCDDGFRARFEAADLIIAKGQGNYESLAGTPRPVFFLFKVKCAAVAATSGLPLGTLALIDRRVGDRRIHGT